MWTVQQMHFARRIPQRSVMSGMSGMSGENVHDSVLADELPYIL
jgi:hypothetical protein